jgi:hypothetical protein
LHSFTVEAERGTGFPRQNAKAGSILRAPENTELKWDVSKIGSVEKQG